MHSAADIRAKILKLHTQLSTELKSQPQSSAPQFIEWVGFLNDLQEIMDTLDQGDISFVLDQVSAYQNLPRYAFDKLSASISMIEPTDGGNGRGLMIDGLVGLMWFVEQHYSNVQLSTQYLFSGTSGQNGISTLATQYKSAASAISQLLQRQEQSSYARHLAKAGFLQADGTAVLDLPGVVDSVNFCSTIFPNLSNAVLCQTPMYEQTAQTALNNLLTYTFSPPDGGPTVSGLSGVIGWISGPQFESVASQVIDNKNLVDQILNRHRPSAQKNVADLHTATDSDDKTALFSIGITAVATQTILESARIVCEALMILVEAVCGCIAAVGQALPLDFAASIGAGEGAQIGMSLTCLSVGGLMIAVVTVLGLVCKSLLALIIATLNQLISLAQCSISGINMYFSWVGSTLPSPSPPPPSQATLVPNI